MPVRALTMEFPSAVRYVPVLRLGVQALCEDVLGPGAYTEEIYQLQLAVSELATNIVVHAYQSDPTGTITVRIVGGTAQVTLDFFDAGRQYIVGGEPSLPAADALAEGGYGMFLIAQCVDRVTHQWEADGRNHWRLEKHFGAAREG